MGAPPLHERLAADLRGFGPPGILSILVVLAGNVLLAPLGAVLALVWARLSRTPWSELGYVRLASWPRTLVTAVLFGIALKFVMKAVVMPLLGAHPVNQAYQFVVGNTAALPGIVLAVIFAAGFGEETLFRGFLFERLRALLGHGRVSAVLIVLLTTALFGIAHLPEQGWDGVKQATVVGLVIGSIFAATRQIWWVMIAHIAFDLTAVWMIYSNLEWSIAHLVFSRR